MTSFSINWNNGEFQKNIDKIIRAFERADVMSPVGKGVFLAGQALLADAQDIVPFDTGFLQKSGQADRVYKDNGDIAIDIAFNSDYAAKLHEDLTLNISQIRASGSGKARQQKYLENPMKENGEKYGNIIARTIINSL